MMKLVNNLEIPDIGLGVYKISEKEMNEVISLAYQDGYDYSAQVDQSFRLC